MMDKLWKDEDELIFDLQKASIWKRVSAFLFDAILLGAVAVGIAFLLSNVFHFDSYNNALQAAYDEYETTYDVTFDISQEQYLNMTDEARQRYDKAYEALISDSDAMYYYNMVINLALSITTIGILIAYLILEFFIPLRLKNGQTLGKKIFGIAVMRTDGVRIVPPLLFIRTILGKFTIETMIPVLIIIMIFFNAIGVIGPLILGLILLLQVILMIVTNTNSCIHDILAKTVTVDFASQMIFDTEEEMLEYKKKAHAEKVARQTY